MQIREIVRTLLQRYGDIKKFQVLQRLPGNLPAPELPSKLPAGDEIDVLQHVHISLQILSAGDGIQPFLPGFRKGQPTHGLITVVDLSPLRLQSSSTQTAQRGMSDAVITDNAVNLALLYAEIEIT